MQKKFANPSEYKRWRRHKRVRNRVVGTPERPRVCVFRSNDHIYAQLIDDTGGTTLLSVSSLKLKAEPAAKPAAKAEAAKVEGAKGSRRRSQDHAGARSGTPAGRSRESEGCGQGVFRSRRISLSRARRCAGRVGPQARARILAPESTEDVESG